MSKYQSAARKIKTLHLSIMQPSVPCSNHGNAVPYMVITEMRIEEIECKNDKCETASIQ